MTRESDNANRFQSIVKYQEIISNQTHLEDKLWYLGTLSTASFPRYQDDVLPLYPFQDGVVVSEDGQLGARREQLLVTWRLLVAQVQPTQLVASDASDTSRRPGRHGLLGLTLWGDRGVRGVGLLSSEHRHDKMIRDGNISDVMFHHKYNPLLQSYM